MSTSYIIIHIHYGRTVANRVKIRLIVKQRNMSTLSFKSPKKKKSYSYCSH